MFDRDGKTLDVVEVRTDQMTVTRGLVSEAGRLDGGAVLPGFTLPVKEIFPKE